MSRFHSADHLDIDEGLSATIKVVDDNGEYIPTFFLSIPERDLCLEEFHTLIEGLVEAKYKIEQLIEIFENGLDN